METVILLSVGGIVGTNLRYWLSSWIAHSWGTDFPLHTLVVNLTGCFLIGFFITITASRVAIDPSMRLFFAIGVLGSYTTFSTYTFESITLLTEGNWQLGLLNLFGSSALGGLSTVIGVLLARQV